ncbi:MAG TPA: hypothetical protein VL992_17975 [Tepidisphaeraceae bacterium]|nr:hypothetical protein [Tepidisphaeraceae bacterium]
MDEIIGYLIQALVDLLRNREAKVAPPTRPAAARRPAAAPRPPAARRPVPPAVGRRGPMAAPRPAPPTFAPRPAAAPAPPQVAPPMARPAAAVSALSVDAVALRRWLNAGTLRKQFILTEIFQPPVALRE